jgi:hypothetical protein
LQHRRARDAHSSRDRPGHRKSKGVSGSNKPRAAPSCSASHTLRMLTHRALSFANCSCLVPLLLSYAFCEFADSATAANAVRHLNGADFNGRPLRVDFSDPSHRSTMGPGAMPAGGGGAAGGGGRGGPAPFQPGGGGAAGQSGDELRRIFANTSAAAAAAPVAPAALESRMADVPAVAYESTIGAQAPAVPPAAQPYVRLSPPPQPLRCLCSTSDVLSAM